MRRTEVSPAFLASLALHGLVIAAIVWSWSLTRNLTIGSAVPVTIVSSGPPDADLRAAEEAPQQQAAQTEQPQPQAPPIPTPPPPQPKPTPAPPTPAPAPAKAKPVEQQAPEKAKPQPKPERSLDLDALAASLTKQTKAANAAKGPNRAETAQQARQTTGAGHSALAMTGLERELQRRWNPNCDVEGGRDVQVKVVFQLAAGGQVVGQVSSQILQGGRGPVAQAAAERAVRAVYAAAPFRDLPPDFYGERIAVNFNARNACS